MSKPHPKNAVTDKGLAGKCGQAADGARVALVPYIIR